MLKEDFRPLTYSEIMEMKPLIVKVSNDITYKTNLLSCKGLTTLWSNKDYITGVMETFSKQSAEAKDSSELISIQTVLIASYKSLISILWEICEKPKKKREVKKQFKRFHDHMMEHFDHLMDLWEKVLVYNSRLFFLLQHLQNLSMVQQGRYSKTSIELSSQPKTITPNTSRLHRLESTIKKNQSEN